LLIGRHTYTPSTSCGTLSLKPFNTQSYFASVDIFFYSIGITVYSITLFTPTIIHVLGFSAAHAQLLSAPPLVSGSILAVLVGTYSDRVNIHGLFVVTGAGIGIIAYAIAYTTSTPGPGYAAAVLVACGVIPIISIALVWAGGNSGGNMKM